MTEEKTTESTPQGSGKSPAISFEKALMELQEAVKKLESGDLPLEEALKAFEEGVRLAGVCQSQLKMAQQKVEILEKSNQEKLLEPAANNEAGL